MRGGYLPLPPEAGWGEETPKSLHAFLLWHANPIPANLQALIRRIARDNPTWGEERIANELRLKYGLRVSPRTVRKYLPKRFDRAPNHGIPSQRWVTFVHNHAKAVVACDFCTVVTASFRLLYVFVLMEHATRRILHGHVTMHPTAQWTIQQLRESVPADHEYRFLINDRDSIFSDDLYQLYCKPTSIGFRPVSMWGLAPSWVVCTMSMGWKRRRHDDRHGTCVIRHPNAMRRTAWLTIRSRKRNNWSIN
jgi:hypothetical protein